MSSNVLLPSAASSKYSLPRLPNSLFEALNSLKIDKNILFSRSEKGRLVVILDRKGYIRKVENILHDKSKFKLITEDVFTFIARMEDT